MKSFTNVQTSKPTNRESEHTSVTKTQTSAHDGDIREESIQKAEVEHVQTMQTVSPKCVSKSTHKILLQISFTVLNRNIWHK